MSCSRSTRSISSATTRRSFATSSSTIANSPSRSAFARCIAIPISAALRRQRVLDEARARPGIREPICSSISSASRSRKTAASAPFRLPVQWINRPHLDFRGFAGTIPSGRVARGDADRRRRFRPSERGRAHLLVADQEVDSAEAGRRRHADARRRGRHRARRRVVASREPARSRRPVHGPHPLDERRADAAGTLLSDEDRRAHDPCLDHRSQAPGRRQQLRQARREAPGPQRSRLLQYRARPCRSPTTPMPKTAKPAPSS